MSKDLPTHPALAAAHASVMLAMAAMLARGGTPQERAKAARDFDAARMEYKRVAGELAVQSLAVKVAALLPTNRKTTGE